MDKFIAHILVVDDDDGIRSLVKKYLNENNFLVTTAENSENALEKIKILKFDLVILDIMMPGKSGLEFIKDNKKKLDFIIYFHIQRILFDFNSKKITELTFQIMDSILVIKYSTMVMLV